MKVIIPIGGGNILNKTTKKIDEYIIRLANVSKPKVLFIPIASNDYSEYVNNFTFYYESLNCEVKTLYLSKTNNDNLIRSLIFSANIIYIGGGNTAKMMRIFKRTHVNEYLKMAYDDGIILTGISAGAMAYFTNGYSDSNRSTDKNANLTLVKCLDFIPYCFCPHYNEQERKSFDLFVSETNFNGIALEDNTALLFIDNEIKGMINANNEKGYFINKNSKEEINNVDIR